MRYNLIKSFASETNKNFLCFIRSCLKKKIKLFEINLLNETILPERFDTDFTKKAIQEYKQWFLSELREQGAESVGNAFVRVVFRNSEISYCVCTFVVKMKDKHYRFRIQS